MHNIMAHVWVLFTLLVSYSYFVAAQCPTSPVMVTGPIANNTHLDFVNNMTCQTTYITTPGSTIFISLSGNLPGPSNTHFNLYDGPSTNSPLLGSFYSFSSLGSVTGRTWSTGNVVTLFFYGDTFPLDVYPNPTTYITAERRSYGPGYCSGLNNYHNVTNVNSDFPLQLHVPENTTSYLPNTLCGWKFEAALGRSVVFSVSTNTLWPGDVIMLYDGPSQASPLITVVTADTPIYIASTGNFLYALLNTSNSSKMDTNSIGFVVYQSDDPFLCPPGLNIINMSTPYYERLYINLPGAGGNIVPPGITCRYLLVAHPDNNIAMTEFNYDNCASNGDTAFIYDGPTEDYPTMYVPRDQESGTVLSSGNQVLVVFHTGNYFGSSGMSLAASENQMIQCPPMTNMAIVNDYRVEDGADYYSGPRVCAYNITSPPGTRMKIYFCSIDLAMGDTLTVFDGNFTKPFFTVDASMNTGEEIYLPNTYVTSSNHVLARFNVATMGSSHRNGWSFELSIRNLSAAQCPPTTSQSNNGSFQAPLVYDASQQLFAAGRVCTYLLTASPGQQVLATIARYGDLGSAHLKVYNGNNANGLLIADITGCVGNTDIELYSYGQSMFMVFNSTNVTTSGVAYGFHVDWQSAFDPFPPSNCSGSRFITLPAGSNSYCLQGDSFTPVPTSSASCSSSAYVLSCTTCVFHVIAATEYTWIYPQGMSDQMKVTVTVGHAPGGLIAMECIGKDDSQPFCNNGRDGVYVRGNFTLTALSPGFSRAPRAYFGWVVSPTPASALPSDITCTGGLGDGGDTLNATSFVVDRGINYDLSPGNYIYNEFMVEAGLECGWTVTGAQERTGVRIEPQEAPFDLYGLGLETYSIDLGNLFIYEGNTTSGALLGWYNSTNIAYIPECIDLPSQVFIQYRAPLMAQAFGFMFPILRVTGYFMPTICSGVMKIKPGGEDTMFGVFDPVGYPMGGYPNGIQCGWLIEGAADSVIRANICPSFRPGSIALVYDGPDATYPQLRNFTFCDGSYNVTATGSVMFIEFVAGNIGFPNGESGLSFSAFELPAPTFCSGVQEIDVYTTLNWPHPRISVLPDGNIPYPRGLICTFIVRSPVGTRLYGQVNPQTEFMGDYITIREGGRTLMYVSGKDQVSFHALCNEVVITFASNEITTVADLGFIIFLEYMDFASNNEGYPMGCRANLFNGVCGDIAIYNSDVDPLTYADCVNVLGTLTVGPVDGGNFTLPLLQTASSLRFITIDGHTFSFPRLESVSGFTVSVGTARLQNLDLPVLSIADTIQFSCLTIRNLSLPALREVHNLFLQSNIGIFNAPSLEYACMIMVGGPITAVNLRPGISIGTFSASGTHSLSVLDLSQSTGIPSIRLTDTSLASVNLASLASIQTLQISSNGALKNINLQSLKFASAICLLQNTQLETLTFPVLHYVDMLTMSYVPVVALQFPLLQFMGQAKLSQMSALTTISFPVLERMDQLRLISTGLTTVEAPVLRSADMLSLQSNTYLSELKMCNIDFLKRLAIKSNPSLSCQDLQAALDFNYGYLDSATSPGYIQTSALFAPNCNPAEVGNFGCAYGATFYVDPSNCGYTLDCIQEQIDAAYSDQLNTVFVPAGTYTGCDTPLNFNGKGLTLQGDRNPTVIFCNNAGFPLSFTQGETSAAIVSDITFQSASNIGGNGGMVVIDGASPVFQRCSFTGGSALNGGIVSVTNSAASSTGVVSPSFVSCTLSGGHATGAGGGIYVSGGATVQLSGTTISACTAAREGGALALFGLPAGTTFTELTIQNCNGQRGGGLYSDSQLVFHGGMITGNTASRFGGGLALVPTTPLGVTVSLYNTTISTNNAPNGGGIYSFSADLTLEGCLLSSNLASRANGGGLFATCSESYRFLNGILGPAGVTLTLRSTTVTSNIAFQGAGVFTRDIYVNIIGGLFDNNNAFNQGGGVAAASSALSVSNTVFLANSAFSGGGVYCEPFAGTCALSGASLTQNHASGAGAGVYFCTAACPGTNLTTGLADIQFGALPPVTTTNSLFGNVLGTGAYGADTATDPNQLSWQTTPSTTAISGRSVVPAGQTLAVLVTDGYGQTVTTASLALTLSVRLPAGTSEADATGMASVGGPTTVLANGGTATFTDVSIVAAALNSTNADYQLQCQLSILPSVYLRAPVHLLPCDVGQGYTVGSTDGVVCYDCAAGYMAGAAATDYQCVICPAGQYAPAASASCTPCAVNTNAPVAGSGSCVPCPDGFSAPAGATSCTQSGSAADVSVSSLGAPVGGALGALLIIALLAALYAWRLARRRTMKKYYLDQDSTIRTAARETPVQRNVKKMLVASSTTRIGGGVYADVYKAKYENLWVALKVLKGEMQGNATALAEFQRETIALSTLMPLDHPGIVRLQFFLQKNPMCIGVEFCINGTLKGFLSTEAKAPSVKIRLLAEAASGMAAIHHAAIAHLDLKTDNVLLDGEFHVKIADFGISKTVDSEARTMPPEFLHQSLLLATMKIDTGSGAGAAPPAATDTQLMRTNPVFDSLANGSSRNNSFDMGSQYNSSYINDPTAVSRKNSAFNPNGSMGSSGSQVMGSSGAMLASTSVENIAFTPQYVDPIRIISDRPGDMQFLQEADVYSFAILMWATMGQAEPYLGESPHALIDRLKADLRMRPDPLGVNMPAFTSLMERCWSHDRNARPRFPEIMESLSGILRKNFATELDDGYRSVADSSSAMSSMASPGY